MNQQSPSRSKKSRSRSKRAKDLDTNELAAARPVAAPPFEKKNIPLNSSFIIPLILCGCFIYLWWIHAWLGDDMNFTVRSVLNFLDGKGIGWNANERVEPFTHPAWFFLLVIGQFVSHSIYESSLFLSFVFSFAAYLALIKSSKHLVALSLAGLLLFSQAFIDYTSSGLENAISYFLLYLVFARFFERRIDTRFYLLSAVTLLNRMDYALILLPAMLWSWQIIGFKIKPVLLGMLPLVLWLLFSTFYFGHPFPNTLLAKMNTGYPEAQYHDRFLNYIAYSFHHDGLTLILIALGIALPLLFRREDAVISLGLLLYAAYLRRIGGDFMAGRFCAIPVYLSVYALIRMLSRYQGGWIHTWPGRLTPLLILGLWGLSVPTPFRNDTHYKNDLFEDGVADERGFYYQKSALALGKSDWVKRHESDEDFISICGMAGLVALVNMDSYIYDSCGLGSPYTARIPAIEIKNWRIGHHNRHMVPGFRCWQKNPSLTFDDPELTRLFNDIRLVSTGSLLNSERIAAIVRLNFDDYAFDRKVFVSPAGPHWKSGEACPGAYDYNSLFHKSAS